MRIKLLGLSPLLITILAAGCAATPAPTVKAKPVADPAGKVGPLTGEKVLALQHEGYTIINRNGEIMYCRAEPKTGTRITHDTVCLTEKEMLALREETQRDLGNVMRQQPAKQGN